VQAAGLNLRDGKTALQEWAQARRFAPPVYRIVARSGPDHAPAFVVAVEIEGYEPAVGVGSSKRSAEQAAAAAFMTREGIGE
jgi:ribonuclease-3